MDIYYSIQENAAKIMIALGVVFLVLGVLTLTAFFAVIPMISLFLGLTFLTLGFFSHIGLLSVEWLSVDGFATILLCSSVVLFALAVASLQFQNFTTAQVALVHFDGYANYPTGLAHENWMILNTERPFLSLSILGTQVGLALFVASVTTKVISHLRRSVNDVGAV
jgi:uncharacterized membrane protein HdeD (DUF308 family)